MGGIEVYSRFQQAAKRLTVLTTVAKNVPHGDWLLRGKYNKLFLWSNVFTVTTIIYHYFFAPIF